MQQASLPSPRNAPEQVVDQEARAGAAPAQRKAIAQVVEHDLLVGAVGHVAGIGRAPAAEILPLLDQAGGQSERGIDGTKLLGIAPCQIVVDGNDMNGAAHECRRRRGQHRRDRLAFAGFHFGQRAAQHGRAAEQLNMVVAQARMPAGGLSRQRERQSHVVRNESC